MHKLILMRHGQSQWNLEDRFTGWVDVDLTKRGRQEAQQAGQLLAQRGFAFDHAYTSVLKRAIRSLWIVLDELNQMWIPTHKSWQLNERHYGALQGLHKKDTMDRYGKEQFFIWRRSYSVAPPRLSPEDSKYPIGEAKYQGIKIPDSENLQNTQERVLSLWKNDIAPKIQLGQRVLIVAHGNSLRALVKHLDQISDEGISGLNIPTGRPIIYELNKELQPTRHYDLE